MNKESKHKQSVNADSVDKQSAESHSGDGYNQSDSNQRNNEDRNGSQSADAKSSDRTNSDVKSGEQNKSFRKGESERDYNRKDEAEKEIHEQQEETGEDAGELQDQDYEETIARLNEELDATRNSMLRKAAEFDNLKKRTQRERIHLYEDAKVDAVLKFLPIREDLKRSVEISRKHKVDPGFLEGLELVLSNFEQVLEQYGVEPIEETGVPFNVDKHDAMLSQPAADEKTESNMVIQVLEPGYKISDRVIRHAKVIVSQ